MRWLSWRMVTVLGAFAVVAGVAAAQEIPGERPACVSVSKSAVMTAFGYDHVVSIRNGCTMAVRCLSSTSSAPAAVSSDLEAGRSVELSLFRGSPASGFTARVECAPR